MQVQTTFYPQYNITKEICQPIPQYAQYSNIVSYIDTVFTLLVPFLVLIILLTLMTVAIMHSIQRKQKRTITKKTNENGTSSSNLRKLPQVRVAKMLYTLSLSVVILNAPSHGFRLKALFSGANHLGGLEGRIFLILLFISYSSFSAKFFICLIFSKNFRKLLHSYFCCGRLKRYRSVPQQTMETAT